MKKYLTRSLGACGIGALCLLTGPGRANDADTLAANVGFQLLEEPINPRAIGMGGAGTALPGGGFAYYNPALPFLLGASYVSADYGQYPQGDLQRGTIEAAWAFRRWFAGAGFTSFSINDIVYADEHGISSITGSWRTSLLSLDAGFSAKSFALGLCVNGAQEGIGGQVGYALSFSGGMAYGILPGKLSVGAAGFHAGTTTGMLDETRRWGEGARLPASARLGMAWSDTLATVGYTVAADVVYRNVNKQIMLPIGFEVRPLPALAVRAGKRFGHDTELFNLGVGLRAGPLGVDMSFVIPRLESDVELKWQAGLTYTLVPPRPAPVVPEKKAVPAPKPATVPPLRPDSGAARAADTAAHPTVDTAGTSVVPMPGDSTAIRTVPASGDTTDTQQQPASREPSSLPGPASVRDAGGRDSSAAHPAALPAAVDTTAR